MQTPETETGIDNFFDDLLAITLETEEKIKSGNITYDDYIEIQLKHFRGKDNDLIRSLTRTLLKNKGVASDPRTWHTTNILFDQVKSVDANYACLLSDPLIVFRFDKFMSFIKDKPLRNPIELRREFIASFPVETYYRGVVILGEPKEIPNSHLAPKIRKMVQGDNELQLYKERLERRRLSMESNAVAGRSEAYLLETPLLRRMDEQMLSHVQSRQTKSEVISVTRLPEIAWYVTSHNDKELWKNWLKAQFLRIYKFKMNSFYAPSVIESFFLSDKDFSVPIPEINFKDADGSFGIGTNSKDIEQLVPIALPVGYDQNYKDFRPEWDEQGFKTKSLPSRTVLEGTVLEGT